MSDATGSRPARLGGAHPVDLIRSVEPFEGLKIVVKEGDGSDEFPVREVTYWNGRVGGKWFLLQREDPCDA